MSNLVTIEQAVTTPKVLSNIQMALGNTADLEQAKQYAAGVLNEIRRSAGNAYGDLTKCSVDSIVHAMIDGARFKVAIDGRKHAHLEMRFNKDRGVDEALLQIDTNGFVAKIAEHYPDVQFSDIAVYEGDEFSISDIDGIADYTYKSANPFQDVNKLQGIAVKIAYTDGGRKVQTIEVVSAAELNMMASKGKGLAWKDFPMERRRTAAIKRACKWHFRKVTGLRELVDYDNSVNTDLDKAARNSPNIIDNINQGLIEQKTA